MLLLFATGCRQETGPGEIRVEASTKVNAFETPPAVSFGIEPVGKQTPEHWRYAASYTRQGKTARFGIDFHLTKTNGDGIRVRVGSGSFMADPKSDDSLLLEDLKQVLKASGTPGGSMRVRELPFRIEVLGENLDRGPHGSLVDAATGNWVSARIFLGVQQDKVVMLNFQKPGGTGEFVSDDPQLGNDVLRELAKVL